MKTAFYPLLVFTIAIDISTCFLQTPFQIKTIEAVPSKSSLYFWNDKESNSNSAVLEISPSEEKEVVQNADVVPFIIEELSRSKAMKASSDIADLVIKIFFEEEAELQSKDRPKNGLTPWKVMQLAYLKNLQLGDVKGKKFLLGRGLSNTMFAAYQIVSCGENENLKPGEKIDISNKGGDDDSIISKNNLEYLPEGTGTFKKGPLLGFVDVTEKTFGLASDSSTIVQFDNNEQEPDENSPSKRKSLRPLLTNLSVKQEARRSGVGSALLDTCEDVVMTSWSTTYNEIVLEVEEENVLAQRFYEKRGYVKLYADPSSRRFDTGGIILRDVPTTKICYRKELKSNWMDAANNNGGLLNLPFFAAVRDMIGAKN